MKPNIEIESDSILNLFIIQRHDAHKEKPPKFETVLVSGGCAYWDGHFWHTRMDSDNGVITWDVTWWADLIYDK